MSSKFKETKKKILVVDDEPQLCQLLFDILDEHGYAVSMANNTEDGLQKVNNWNPDLLLLDVRMPTIGGLEFCRLLRQQDSTRHIPIIMLTVQSSETDKVIGFEIGADDYLTKPFSQKELLARIKAVMRRTFMPKADMAGNVLSFEDLTVNLDSHVVKLHNSRLGLTPKEFNILVELLKSRHKVVGRESLMSSVWGYSYPEAMGTLDVHIRHLRKKLGRFGRRIKTVVGVGYWFE